MNPYDYEQVQAVWQRVTGRQESEELAAKLPEIIAAEHASARGYEKMSRQAGKHGAMFRRMAAEEWQHAKKLTSLYELLYNCQPEIAAGIAQESCSFWERVCRSFRGELGAAEQYHHAAKSWPQHRELFEALAAEEERHSRNLHRLAQQLRRS